MDVAPSLLNNAPLVSNLRVLTNQRTNNQQSDVHALTDATWTTLLYVPMRPATSMHDSDDDLSLSLYMYTHIHLHLHSLCGFTDRNQTRFEVEDPCFANAQELRAEAREASATLAHDPRKGCIKHLPLSHLARRASSFGGERAWPDHGGCAGCRPHDRRQCNG